MSRKAGLGVSFGRVRNGEQPEPQVLMALKHLQQKSQEGLAHLHGLLDEPHWVPTARKKVEVTKKQGQKHGQEQSREVKRESHVAWQWQENCGRKIKLEAS